MATAPHRIALAQRVTCPSCGAGMSTKTLSQKHVCPHLRPPRQPRKPRRATEDVEARVEAVTARAHAKFFARCPQAQASKEAQPLKEAQKDEKEAQKDEKEAQKDEKDAPKEAREGAQ
jgi:hypothetical protein